MARPGAVSRAHRGVLFLDEYAEIGVSALEALRTPLEDGEIRLARRDGVARYPARFQLVLAANPCPCAPADPRDCICALGRQAAVSGQAVRPAAGSGRPARRDAPERAGAFAAEEGESTAVVRDRVTAARDAAAAALAASTASGPTPRSAAHCCAASFGRRRRRWSRCKRRSTAACSASAASTGHCGSRGQ